MNETWMQRAGLVPSYLRGKIMQLLFPGLVSCETWIHDLFWRGLINPLTSLVGADPFVCPLQGLFEQLGVVSFPLQEILVAVSVVFASHTLSHGMHCEKHLCCCTLRIWPEQCCQVFGTTTVQISYTSKSHMRLCFRIAGDDDFYRPNRHPPFSI